MFFGNCELYIGSHTSRHWRIDATASEVKAFDPFCEYSSLVRYPADHRRHGVADFWFDHDGASDIRPHVCIHRLRILANVCDYHDSAHGKECNEEESSLGHISYMSHDWYISIYPNTHRTRDSRYTLEQHLLYGSCALPFSEFCALFHSGLWSEYALQFSENPCLRNCHAPRILCGSRILSSDILLGLVLLFRDLEHDNIYPYERCQEVDRGSRKSERIKTFEKIIIPHILKNRLLQFMVMMFYRMKSIGQIEVYSIFLLFCIMNHNRAEGEGQKSNTLRATKRASQVIQGLVVASIVSIASPGYSQEKKSDKADISAVTKNVSSEREKQAAIDRAELQVDYIAKQLADSGKTDQFLYAILQADSNIKQVAGGTKISSADITKIISNIPERPTSAMMIKEGLSDKRVVLAETIVGKVLGYDTLKQALILESDSTTLSVPDPSIPGPTMTREFVRDFNARVEFNKNYSEFVEKNGKAIIREMVMHPERFSKDQQAFVSKLSKQLAGKDITKTSLADWMDPADALILNKVDGLHELSEKMSQNIQSKISATTQVLKTQGENISNLSKEAEAIRNELKTLTDAASKKAAEELLQKKEEAIYMAKLKTEQETKRLFDDARSYIGIVRSLGQAFGNSETAKTIADVTFVADNILTIVENANKLMGAANAAGSFASGNMIGAAMSIVGMFSKKPDAGAERHKAVMEALQKLSKQITELKKEMHDRFDRVDSKLDIISVQLGNMQGDITIIKEGMSA